MSANAFHILLEDGSYLLAENGLAHFLLETAPSLLDEHTDTVEGFQDCAFQSGAWQGALCATATPRGDDAHGLSYTGQARRAIYERQIEEIEERLTVQPPKTAKKRRKKLEYIEEKLELLATQPLPDVYRLNSVLEGIEAYDGSQERYTAILESLGAYFEHVRLQARKARHRKIAIAMLMAA